MPCDCGRNVEKLADLSRRAGPTSSPRQVSITPATTRPITGRSCPRSASSRTRFALDITDGIDANDDAAPTIRRTDHRAGVIKIAGKRQRPVGPRPAGLRAAALAHRWTGARVPDPLQGGTGASTRSRCSKARVPPARDPQPRRQGRRPGVHRSSSGPGPSPSTTARSAGVRGQRHADAAGRPSRTTSRVESCWEWTRPGRATTTRTAVSPGSPGCSTDLLARWALAGRPGCATAVFVENPARAYAFASTPPAGR